MFSFFFFSFPCTHSLMHSSAPHYRRTCTHIAPFHKNCTICCCCCCCSVAPVVESFTFPKNLTRGKRLRAVCTVTEGDLPIDIEWRKDGVTLLPDVTLSGPKVRRIDEYTSLLAISSLDTVHAGNYSCVASNAVAEVAKWAVLTIRGKICLHALLLTKRTPVKPR